MNALPLYREFKIRIEQKNPVTFKSVNKQRSIMRLRMRNPEVSKPATGREYKLIVIMIQSSRGQSAFPSQFLSTLNSHPTLK